MNLPMFSSDREETTLRQTILRWLAQGAIALLIVMLALTSIFDMRNKLAEHSRIALYLGEHMVGYLENEAVINRAADRLTADIYRDTGVLYAFDGRLSYRIMPAEEGIAELDEQRCYECLQTYSVKDFVLGYSLMWDGEYLCSLATEEEIHTALDELIRLEEQQTEADFDNIQLANEIQIVNRYCAREDIIQADELTAILTGQADYDYVNYETALQTIAYETIYERDDTHYPYYCIQDVEGVEGEQLVEYELAYREDGSLSSKVAISTYITKEATNAHIIQGTKAYPEPGITTGSFIWPLAVAEVPYISSYYGNYRELFDSDGYHRGIDIPLDTGTPVYAADGGMVTHCGETESYGKSVILTHDNGFRTVYAHLDQIDVKYGDAIYQGQMIGTTLLKKIMEEYHGVYQLHLLTDNTEKTVAFYKSLGFAMDTDMDCRAFSKYCVG